MAKKDSGMSKVAMVREAIAKIGWNTSTEDLRKYIKDNFATDMSIAHISQTKSTEKKRQGVSTKKRRKRGRPPGSTKAASAAAAAAGDAKISDILSFVAAVHEWQAKIGVANVKEVFKSVLKK
jgi:ribosomal protein L19E